MSKKKVGILFGGKSSEHEVSLQSAKNIVDAIDKEKYEVVLIGIDKEGGWHVNDQSHYLLHAEDPKLISLNKTNEGVAVVPGSSNNQMLNLSTTTSLGQLDAVFPILHGTLGEDGSIQGMFRLANIPYVGANVLGSAMCMDKDITKRLLRDAGIGVANWFSYKKHQKDQIQFEDMKENLGLPFFVKPANQGSSVGVSKVRNEAEFTKAIEEAFLYDYKVIIEEGVVGREIECSVLGNENPKASVPGEILSSTDFYSYETKYIDESGASLEIPASLDQETEDRVRQIAIEAFQVLECEGLSRVDVFLKDNGEIIVNEINTLPGFTKISMYPKLWEASGISYPALIDELIELAIQRHERDASLKNTREE
ncbi:D-alanine--D-alanine ligase [Pontibacillus yanchengensis]|uniref:D-alanine--D-alanine ligase n=1 Tax=Pontibacillus yanchengensis Y32 TaxID=1385514 RepID=A0A0A2TVS8_9BACI|nr:D-alanine--D-alanine ligase [Pontibacillus yanchengensis]KGP73350.1 D-alanine--D-alanine ligase [Pontibacillus yanchengensis Y32]